MPRAGEPWKGSSRTGGRPTSLAVRISAGLVAFVTAVLCLYAVLMLSMAEHTVRERILTGLDTSLQRAAAQIERSGASVSPDQVSPDGIGLSLPTGVGHESGTLVVVTVQDLSLTGPSARLQGYILDAVGGQRALTDREHRELLLALHQAPLQGSVQVQLEGVAYQLASQPLDLATPAESGQILTVGVPIQDELRTLEESRVLTLGSVAVIIIVVAIGSWAWVRRSLEPLSDVAQSADAVSALPVGAPGVHLADCAVPESEDRRPDEVSVVATAFNGMLSSMDEFLAERTRQEDMLRRFVADASHELRTPLASIRGYTEMIGLTEQLTDRGRESQRRVLAQADRMSALVDDLLLLARLDAAAHRSPESESAAPGRDAAPGRPAAAHSATPGRPGPGVEARVCSLAELVVEAVQDARAAGPDHRWHVEVSEEKLESRLRVCGDPVQLERVLGNLLSNARKHTPAGTCVQASVDVVPFSGAESGRGVRVVVQDDGPGIPEEIMPVLFDRFVRVSAAREPVEGSTGLGLAIVKAVVEAHGGTITADSEPGRTRFVMTLPGVEDEGAGASCPRGSATGKG